MAKGVLCVEGNMLNTIHSANVLPDREPQEYG